MIDYYEVMRSRQQKQREAEAIMAKRREALEAVACAVIMLSMLVCLLICG
ncbi:MAG: hypothetical protein WCS52_15650 [bacterium]